MIARSTEEPEKEATMTNEDTPIAGPLNNVIRIDDERIKGICTGSCAARPRRRWPRSWMRKRTGSVMRSALSVLRGHSEGAEAQAPDVRDGHHRELSASESLRQRSTDRDVSGQRFRAPRRGYHRVPMRNAGITVDGQRPQRRSTRRSINGGTGRSRASIRMFISTAP